ncbi:General stress protein 69 [Planctomycetes bacterium Poly30]|uniref:General stress protein 69 n=2 Tax=Saltatorellus ferox TaxID=2528018 RepID=A0A518F060_9BACT|nr:General stress protein 69 [Planctomycetes bacterium Poly30]
MAGALASDSLAAGNSASVSVVKDRPACSAIRRGRIPSTGELLPRIGLGTSRTFDVDPAAENPDELEVVKRFLDWGGSLIDSSPMYKRAEAVVGALSGRLQRDDFFYATKVWTDEGKEAGIAQMTRSEELMGAKHFDLMQVHNLVGLDVHMETLKEWKASGRVRYVGVTEMQDFAKVEELVASDALDFIQIPYSVTDRRVEERVLPACIEHGVGVLVMRPFQAGKLFAATKELELPGWAADFGASSWGQLFLKFILGHDAMTVPIPATSKPHHLDDNMGAGVGPALDGAARGKLIAILEG